MEHTRTQQDDERRKAAIVRPRMLGACVHGYNATSKDCNALASLALPFSPPSPFPSNFCYRGSPTHPIAYWTLCFAE